MSYNAEKLTGFELEVYMIANRSAEESAEAASQDKTQSLTFRFVKDQRGQLVQRPLRVVATGPKAHELDDLVVLFPGQRLSVKDMASEVIRWENLYNQGEFKDAS